VSKRYRHELCFSGPKDIAALVEAAEKAGFKLEFGSSEPEEGFVGQAAQRDEAQHELDDLRGRLADRRGEPSD
jgi:hypothetical protein